MAWALVLVVLAVIAVCFDGAAVLVVVGGCDGGFVESWMASAVVVVGGNIFECTIVYAHHETVTSKFVHRTRYRLNRSMINHP